MIILTHDYSGHNGSRRTYSCLKKQYCWPGIRKQVFRHCKKCRECILQNQGQPERCFGHFDSPDLPMEFICMDLVGPIHPPSSRGNRYVLTVIDMLTGFTMAVSIRNKNAKTICDAYRDHIYCTFRGSSRILTDNGSEFKNQEMKQVCEMLGIKHIFSPVYTPELNGCLKGWHRFFKACITKHIRGGGVEWDELVPLAVSAYNFFPCQSTKESPFVLMFSRDLITPVAKLLEPKPRYYGEKGASLKMDTLRRLYAVVAENIPKAREKKPQTDNKKPHTFKVNDMVLVKDPDSAVFEPRYQPNYRVTAIFGDNRIEVQDEKGHKSVRRSSHVKYVEPSDKLVQQLPSREILQNFGRSSKLLIPAKDILDLHFKLTEMGENTDFAERNTVENDSRSIVGVALKYSENHEHSEKSLRGITDMSSPEAKPLQQVKTLLDTETHVDRSESSERSGESRVNEVCVLDVQNDRVFARNGQQHLLNSESSEESLNSQITTREKQNKETSEPVQQWCQQNPEYNSEYSEASPDSRVTGTVSELETTRNHRHCSGTGLQETQIACKGNSSESSLESSNGVGINVSVPKLSWFKNVSKLVGLTAAWQHDKVEGATMGTNTVSTAKVNNNSVHIEFNFFL